jgi:protein involved in polysaccharide export with SLBB domain
MIPAAAQEVQPSLIERAFSDGQTPLTVSRILRQFGYSLFGAPSSTFTPVENMPVGPDYVVGPGDTMYVTIWGLVENYFQVTVERNGEIVLPKAGPVRVAGLKFVEAADLIKEQLSQYYTRINVSVTMGPLRSMKVFILGEVVKPGTYTVSSLSTVTNALFVAGGPSTQGSLREIRLIRNNRIIARLDLYRFLLEGNRAEDERLMPDDAIFVPPIGPVVALAGYVKRPAIYELKNETSLSQLLEMAGGLTIMSYLKRVQVERIVERQRKVVLDTEFTDVKDFEARAAGFALQEGDFVSLFPIDQALYSFVTLEGNVRRPGTYALKPNMRVKDLIDQAEGLLPGSYMGRADLAKFYDGRQAEVFPLDLGAVLRGDPEQDVLLDQFDRVIVYHKLDIQPKPLIQISGAVNRPGVFELTPNMWLSDLVFKGGPTRQASYRNAEIYRADPGKSVVVIPLDLEKILARPRSDKDLVLMDRDHLYIREHADGVEKLSVSIAGYVKYPGEYAFTRGERLSSVIERAGGFLPEAFPKGAVFTRQSVREVELREIERFIRTQEQSLLAESSAVTAGASALLAENKADVASAQAAVLIQRRELLRSLSSVVTLGRVSIQLDGPERLKATSYDIMLENGDNLFVPQQPTSVLVLGAVRNSTALLYAGAAEKQNPDVYIAKAGGATREADLDQMYILKADGSTISTFPKLYTVEAGDTIIVPLSTEPKYRTLPMLRDIATILTGFALPFATVAALLK